MKYRNHSMMYLFVYGLLISLALCACNGSGESQTSFQDPPTDVSDNGGSGTGGNTGDQNNDDSATDSSADSVWIMNMGEQRAAHILEAGTGLGVLVNVQSVTEQSVNGVDYTVMESNGVPKYDVIMTEQMIEELNTRPRAASDFVGGQVSVDTGAVVSFGEDIGYRSNNGCESNAGYGYWPPGPECPQQSSRTAYLPKEPQPATQTCASGLGAVGFWVNGSSVFNWGDGQSYNRQGDWQTLAPIAEGYDVDICGGHAARGEYHHHFYSQCLADLVGDTADGHSPIYGYAADGYPIYGPWEDDGVLAVSSWTVRDYSATAVTGCTDGKRSCTLVDPYDPGRGTVSTSQGPDFDQVVTTLSRNELVAFNGYFYEDYYWDSDLTNRGGAYLDQYNGHSDGERGYHYHVTVVMQDGKLVPSFPYTIGDRFAGSLQDNAAARCGSGQDGPGLASQSNTEYANDA